MSSGEVKLLIRFAIDSDVDMITSDWLNSFRDGYFNTTVPNRVYFGQHHKILENLLPKSNVIVLCNSEKPTQALGWMCYEIDGQVLIVHYLYVKNLFRNRGLARKMFEWVFHNEGYNLAKNVVMTTHQTQKSKEFIRGNRKTDTPPYNDRHPDKPIDWIYNPYALFYRLDPEWQK